MLKYFNFNVKIDKKLPIKYVPIMHGVGVANLVDKEPWFEIVLSTISSTIKDKEFVDCGVNIGQTLIKVKNLDPGIRYSGFEPNQACVWYTEQLIRLNGIENAFVFPFGVAEETQVRDLQLNETDETDSNASMVPGFRPGHFRKVPCFFLKPMIKIWENQMVGCIKIDVEGGELEVIKGFKDLIKRDRPCIICEVLPVYDSLNGLRLERQNELISLLKELNYTINRINLTDGSLFRLEYIEIHSDLDLCNYLFMPDKGVL